MSYKNTSLINLSENGEIRFTWGNIYLRDPQRKNHIPCSLLWLLWECKPFQVVRFHMSILGWFVARDHINCFSCVSPQDSACRANDWHLKYKYVVDRKLSQSTPNNHRNHLTLTIKCYFRGTSKDYHTEN